MSDPPLSAANTQPNDGRFVPPTPEQLQALLPQFEVLGLLGQGGMGAVYKARQINLDRLVAIKILPNDPAIDTFNFAERFQREAQAMAKFSHQRIVSVYDFGQVEMESPAAEGASGRIDLLYIVMEYVEGTDLHDLIEAGELSSEHIVAIITQVCDALQYAHDKGIVHRDIKPANIMLDTEGQVKVADFGLAKLTDSQMPETQLTMTNMVVGTPDYLAPEQLEVGSEPDHRADIYALGVMMYQLLTGKVPRGAFRAPSQIKPSLDARLDQVVLKALQTDPDSRYQQVSQLWTDVEQISRTPPPGPVAPKKGPPKAAPSSGGSSKAPVIAGVFVLLAVVAGAGFYFLRPPAESPPSPLNQPVAEETGKGKGKGKGKGMDPSLTPGEMAAERRENRQGKAMAPVRPGPPAKGADRIVSERRINRKGIVPPPPAPDASLAPTGPPVDLLALVDPERDTRLGTWSTGPDHSLVHKAESSYARLDIPIELTGAYRLRLTYTGPAPGKQVGVGFRAGPDHSASVRIDGSRDVHATGLALLDGQMPDQGSTNPTFTQKFRHQTGKKHQLELTVVPRGSQVTVKLNIDGQNLIDWSGSQSSLRLPPLYEPKTPVKGIAFTTARTNVTFLEASLTLLNGAALTHTAPKPGPGPPPDAIEFAGNHYKYFNERLRWAAAAARAKELGGYLVSIHSSEENRFVRSLLPPNPPGSPWLGLLPQSEGQPWLWEDGTTTAEFSVWKNRQRPAIAKPDGTQFRGAIRPEDGAWGNISASFVGPYIVEWGKPANGLDGSTSSSATSTGSPIDLLALTNPPLNPEWIFENGHLTRSAGKSEHLPIPFTAPTEYRLEMALQTHPGKDRGLYITLPTGDRHLEFQIDVGDGTGLRRLGAALEGRDHSHPANPTSHIYPSPLLSKSSPTQLIFLVHENSLSVDVDGKRYVDWTGSREDLPRSLHRIVQGEDVFGKILLRFRGAYTISKLSLTPFHSSSATPSAPPTGNPIDLLATIDPNIHALATRTERDKNPPPLKFERKAEGIAFTAGRVGMLVPPVQIPASYDLALRVRPREKMTVTLPFGTRYGTLVLNKQVSPAGGGLEQIDGMTIQDPNNPTVYKRAPIKNDVESNVLIQVRDKGAGLFSLEVVLEGKPLTSWEGEASRLTTVQEWTLPEPHRLGLGCATSGRYGSTWLAATLRPVDAASPPSESEAGRALAAVLADYRQTFASTLGKAHAEKVATLNGNYGKALDRESKKVAAAGNLDGSVHFKTEIEAVSALEKGAVLMAPLSLEAPSKLQEMRATYRKTIQTYGQNRDADAATLLRQLDDKLVEVQSAFTRSQKIEAALEIRQAREELKRKGVSVLTEDVSLTPPGDWITLLNGSDFSGWKITGNASDFRFEDGVLRTTGGPSYLSYLGPDGKARFSNFEFTTQVRTESSANSGIYFHINPPTSTEHPKDGYEIQIYNGTKGDSKTGSLYGVQDEGRATARDNSWFELGIRVDGKTITSTVNGKTVVEWTEPEDWKGTARDPQRRLGSGVISIQNHGIGGDVSFKEMKIRALPQ